MAFDYAELAAAAAEILADFGATGQLKRKERSGDYDPETGTFPETTVTQQITAVVIAYPQHLIDGTTVLQGDELAYVSAVGLTMPKPLDVMTWMGSDYTVINAKPTAPAGLNVLAEVQVRR